MAKEQIKTKALLCREIHFKDDVSYLQGFSPSLGFASFLKKNTKGQKYLNALSPFQLVQVMCQVSGQAYQILESEILFSFQFLVESVEAQALLNILLDFSRDLTMEQDEKEELYELLVYAFYALEQQGQKHSFLSKEMFLKILALAEIKLLFLFSYIQSPQDEPLKEYAFQKRFMELLAHLQHLSLNKLFTLELKTTEIYQLLHIASQYFRMLFSKDYNHLEYFNSLFAFQHQLPLKKREL